MLGFKNIYKPREQSIKREKRMKYSAVYVYGKKHYRLSAKIINKPNKLIRAEFRNPITRKTDTYVAWGIYSTYRQALKETNPYGLLVDVGKGWIFFTGNWGSLR
jgi:hypothetical protein